MLGTWAGLTVGHPCKVSGYVPLGKHPRLFWYTKLLEDTTPNTVYNQGNGYDILNDENYVEYWSQTLMRLLPWAGISAPLTVPAVSPPALLLLIKKLIQSWKERSLGGGGVGQDHVGFGWQYWAHVPTVPLPASGTSLFISIHWKIQCQPELQLGALFWVWATCLQEEEGKSCSDWACSVI